MLKVKVASVADAALLGKARVAKEGTTRRFHLESEGEFEVPRTAYYLRKITRGELVLASANQAPARVLPDKKQPAVRPRRRGPKE